MNEYLAYEGTKLSIEWYFDKHGKSHVLNYYKKLTLDERIKVLRLFKRLGDNGEIKDTTKFNYEGNQIYAFKPQPERFLCFFFEGKRIIITNAFRKKQQQMLPKEKQKAINYKKDYITRFYAEEYYEKN